MNLQGVVSIMMSLFSQERLDQFKHDEAVALGIEIGEARGEARGEFNLLVSLVRENIVSSEYAARKLGITVEEFEEKCKNLQPLQV